MNTHGSKYQMLPRFTAATNLQELIFVDVEELISWWNDDVNSGNRTLEKCLRSCTSAEGMSHSPDCQYAQGVDPHTAVKDAVRYLERAHAARLGLTMVTAEAMGLPADGSAQTELTLSLITDPIAVRSNGRFSNGRHRLQTLVGAGIVGGIPVSRGGHW